MRTTALHYAWLWSLLLLSLKTWPGAQQEPPTGAEVSQTSESQTAEPAAPAERERAWSFVSEARDVLEPADAAFSRSGTLFVAERGAHQVAVFELVDGELLRVAEIGTGPGGEPGELFRPGGVAVTGDGHVVVADTGNHRLQIFGPGGEFVRTIGRRGRAQGEFDQPSGLDVRGERIYVADVRNDRVQVLSLEGESLLTLGGFGTEDGLFDAPLDVAVEESGGFYVVDSGNSRVQHFNANGRHAASFGAWGSFPGLLDGVTGASWGAGRLFVAERHNHRVQVFAQGEANEQWGLHAIRPREGAGKLHYPNDVALSPDGFTALVCESFENRVQLFRYGPRSNEVEAPDPRLLGTGGAPHYGQRVDTAGDLLVLLEPVTHSVLIFDLDAETPVLVHSMCGYGRRFGRTVLPSDVVLGEDARRLWVVDRGNRRLQEFALRHDPTEQPLRFQPQMSTLRRAIELDSAVPREERAGPVDPVAIERDKEGRFYVLDARSAKVHVLDAAYAHQRSFAGWGTGAGELREPSDMAWDASGKTLYVVDSHNARVLAFSPEGEVQKTIGERGTEPGQFTAPFGITGLRSGGVLVVDEGSHRISVFDSAGRYTRGWGTLGLGAGEFFKPKGVVQIDDGRLVVIDFGNHRGQFFDLGGKFGGAFGARLFVKETRPRAPRQPVRND